MRFFIATILLLLLFIGCQTDSSKSQIEKKNVKNKKENTSSNFIQISTQKSNLEFSNTLKHNLNTNANLFDFDFFYNGAGVGIADINNDGLQDIFFCGNQVENKLYLNKGNLQFEDISEKANINTNKFWSNGVTFADINQDGWMDIYVSQGGPYSKEKRGNLLFINQKDNTFKESAEAYGLKDFGLSTQTVFFDFDKDGDLDCVVMNENDYYGLDPSTFYKVLSNKKLLKENSSHFYKNENGKFINITEKAGLLRPSFGLGICVSDLNNDGWPDIYMTNDYYVPDAMYINNRNGTFTDRIKSATNQITFYGMGVDIGDINNDNLKDIFVLDMASSDHIRSKTLMASMNVPQFNLLVNTLGLQIQYMYNSLQLNVGNNKYHNISQLTGLSKTDWSWAGLIFDTNNDEKNDIYITNGYRRYGLDNDIRMKVVQAKNKYRGKVPILVKEEIYNSLPSEKLSNILFRNKGNLKFENATSYSGLSVPSFSNGGAYADLDNDGDLDLVVNNIDENTFLFKNLAIENKLGNYLIVEPKGKLSETFAKVTIAYNGKQQTKESKRVRGYFSSVDNSIHFGLSNNKIIDTVRITWQSGKTEEKYKVSANSKIIFNEKDAKTQIKPKINNKTLFEKRKQSEIKFTHVENNFNDFNKEVLLPYKQSTLGPFIAKGDVNNDGLTDIFIGGAKNQSASLFIQTKSGFIKSKQEAFLKDAKQEDMEALFVDIDNDGDYDLYVVSGGSEFKARSNDLADRLYLNDGKGNFTKDISKELNTYTISGKTVSPIDFDKDGDMDLIVGNRIVPQKYPLHEPSLIFENNNGVLKNVTDKVAPAFLDFGIVNKVITTDVNNDGWDDFIAVGEWTGIGIFINDKGVFKNSSEQNNLHKEKGWWFSIMETDVNNDGNKDYVIGNVGLNIKFKVSPKKPLRIYADDFDGNGTHDVVLSYKYNGLFVPARGKECSTQQMPFISKKIPTYNQFAHSSLEDIYGEKIFTAYQREVTNFYSVLLLNKGDGNFDIVKLPIMAQTLPILDSAKFDFNKDGYEDMIVVGNIYNTEVETPRLDNPYALILLSNQKNGYDVLGPEKTGLYLVGNTKSVEVVKKTNGGKVLVFIATNNGEIQEFELKN